MGICYGTPVDDSRSKPPSPGFTHADRHQPRKLQSNNCKTGDHNGSEAAGRKTCGDDDDDRRASCEEKKNMKMKMKMTRTSTSNVASSGQIVMAAPNPKLNSNITEMKMFRFQELRAATRNFRPDTILGEGGFGRVFKGWIDPVSLSPAKVGLGIPVAVKKSNPDSQQGLQEWQAEVKFLGKFCHPNLVKLIGYCWEDNQFLLVYEYMQKGSLENHLFRKGAEPFPWDLRLKIAIGAAKGLSFLHCSEKSVIYRDFKASNILLDESYNAKLSDFGLAKFGPIDGNSHVTTRVMGTYGYTAPEYVATGHLYVKSDVYGFGVVLLEMLTGLRALDTTRPSGEHNLVDFTRPSLTDKRKLKKIMDPRLEGEYPVEAALLAAQLIIQCFEAEPKNRPSMDHVLQTLQTVSLIENEPKKKTKKNTTTARSKNNQRRLPADHTGTSPLHSKHHGHGVHHNGTRSRPHRY